jgi:hypothetical protein
MAFSKRGSCSTVQTDESLETSARGDDVLGMSTSPVHERVQVENRRRACSTLREKQRAGFSRNCSVVVKKSFLLMNNIDVIRSRKHSVDSMNTVYSPCRLTFGTVNILLADA